MHRNKFHYNKTNYMR